jgi:hypothetical protein
MSATAHSPKTKARGCRTPTDDIPCRPCVLDLSSPRAGAVSLDTRPAPFSLAECCDCRSTKALRDVNNSAASIALTVNLMATVRLSFICLEGAAPLSTGYARETCDDGAGTCLRPSNDVRACGRPDEPRRTRCSPRRQRRHDHTLDGNQTSEPFRECPRSHRA